jgi:hypothetical protein
MRRGTRDCINRPEISSSSALSLDLPPEVQEEEGIDLIALVTFAVTGKEGYLTLRGRGV